MANVIKILFLVILLSSCLTQKQRDKVCKNCPVQIHDSIIEKLVEVPIYMPPIQGPILYVENPCSKFCDSLGNLKPFYIEKEKDGIKTTVTSNTITNSLEINSVKKADSTKVFVPTKEKYQKVTIPARCTLKHRSKWDYFTEVGFYIFACLTALKLTLNRLKNGSFF